jgi:hypothetical protein
MSSITVGNREPLGLGPLMEDVASRLSSKLDSGDLIASEAATQYRTGSGKRPDLPLSFLECCGGKHRHDR